MKKQFNDWKKDLIEAIKLNNFKNRKPVDVDIDEKAIKVENNNELSFDEKIKVISGLEKYEKKSKKIIIKK